MMKLKVERRSDRPFEVPEAGENLRMRLLRFSVMVGAVLVFVAMAM